MLLVCMHLPASEEGCFELRLDAEEMEALRKATRRADSQSPKRKPTEEECSEFLAGFIAKAVEQVHRVAHPVSVLEMIQANIEHRTQ